MFDRLLVPLDRSRLAEQVFPTVTELARSLWLGGGPSLMSAGRRTGRNEQACHGLPGAQGRELRAALAGSAATLDAGVIAGRGRRADSELLPKPRKFDLIVMSSHGRSGITRWSLGGTVDRVLRRSTSPF